MHAQARSSSSPAMSSAPPGAVVSRYGTPVRSAMEDEAISEGSEGAEDDRGSERGGQSYTAGRGGSDSEEGTSVGGRSNSTGVQSRGGGGSLARQETERLEEDRGKRARWLRCVRSGREGEGV